MRRFGDEIQGVKDVKKQDKLKKPSLYQRGNKYQYIEIQIRKDNKQEVKREMKKNEGIHLIIYFKELRGKEENIKKKKKIHNI